MNQTPLALLLFVLLIPFSGCTSDPETPEEQIRRLIDAGEAAVEARDLSDVAELISERYLDKEGLDHAAVKRFIAAQFLMYPSIHLLVQVDEIRLLTPEQARARIFVGMSATQLAQVEDLLGMRADLYRFDLDLEREGENWRVSGGAWRRATSADFFR